MNNKDEKIILEFERLERIAQRIITENKVTWGDFLLCMNAVIIDISMRGYAPNSKICKEALSSHLSKVLSELDDYYDTEEED